MTDSSSALSDRCSSVPIGVRPCGLEWAYMSDHVIDSPEVDLSKPPAEGMVRVTFLPEGRTVEFEFDSLQYEGHGRPMSFLDVAENFGIFLDHACGGVCACTTCHLHVKEGASGISEAEDLELDRLETAAGIELNSRLGCQAVIERPGTYVVQIPKWNRNYVQEGKPAHGPGS
jgi:2Fe-2S ferredoxin